MASGPEHYVAAERLLQEAQQWVSIDFETQTGERKSDVLAAALVHATLAQAAASVAPRYLGPQEPWGGHPIDVGDGWPEVTSSESG